MLALLQPSTLMTKTLLFCLLLLSTLQDSRASYMITDGRSLVDGLDIFVESQAGTRRVTWEETVRGTMAASYAQAFASACVVWQMKFPKEAPFNLPSSLMADQFVKVAHKYLKEHPDR